MRIPNSAEPGYIAHWGNFAALSPKRELVAQKPTTGLKVQGAALNKQLSEKQIIFMGNMPAIKAMAMPKIEKNRDEIVGDIERGMNQAQMAESSPMSKAAAQQILNVATRFLEESQGAAFAINFGNEGISTTLLAEFTPGSYMGNLVSQLHSSDEQMLAGLPTGKYLFLGGMNLNSDALIKAFDDATGPIMNAMGEGQANAADIKRYMMAMRSSLAATKSQSWGFLSPEEGADQQQLMQIIAVQRGDAKTLRAAMKEVSESQAAFQKAMGQENGMQATITPNVKTVGGVQFDQISQTRLLSRHIGIQIVRQTAPETAHR